MDIVRVSRGRRVLGGLVGLVVVAALVTPTARAAEPSFRPALVDVTGWRHLAGPTVGVGALAGPALPGPSVSAGIGPGSYLLIDRDDGAFICTANFVWNGPGGAKYLGAAGHCFLTPDVESSPASNPGDYVTAVRVCVASCAFGGQLGAVLTGTLETIGPVVHARQSVGGTDIGNDFGLVEIPPRLHGLIRTTVPVWGGPTSVQSPPSAGSPVCLYGNATVFGEVFATKARLGLAGQSGTDAWFATLPSAPGDSGSAVVRCPGLTGGAAVGILTHLGTNGTGIIAGTTVDRAKAMVLADVSKTIDVAL